MQMLIKYDHDKVKEVYRQSRAQEAGYDEMTQFNNFNHAMRQSMPNGFKNDEIRSDDSFEQVSAFEDEKKMVDRSMPDLVVKSLDLTKLKGTMGSSTPRLDSKNSQVLIDSVTFRET